MAEEEYGVVPYRDISELKRQLENIQDRKDVSSKDLYGAVKELAATMGDMLEVFGAAADQLKLEEKEYDAENRKHEMIISKLDKLIDQNKTIAEGMVAIVEMVKEKLGSKEEQMFKQKDDDVQMFKPQPEQKPFARPQPDWKPAQEPMQRQQPSMQPMPMIPPPLMPQPSVSTQYPDLDQMPPMEPSPMPDLDFPEEPFPLDEEHKKKSLFGMFKK